MKTDAETGAEYYLERTEEAPPVQVAQVYALLAIAQQLGLLAEAIEKMSRE